MPNPADPDSTPAVTPISPVSLIAGGLAIAIAASFAWYGLLGSYAKAWGWPWYAGWALAILLPPFAYISWRTGSVRGAVAPFLFISTIGLLLAIVFPVALL